MGVEAQASACRGGSADSQVCRVVEVHDHHLRIAGDGSLPHDRDIVPRRLQRRVDLGGEEEVRRQRDDPGQLLERDRAAVLEAVERQDRAHHLVGDGESTVTSITAWRPVPPAGAAGFLAGLAADRCVEAMLTPCSPSTVPTLPIMPGTSE